jgi:DNA-binding response OmpR family regulator
MEGAAADPEVLDVAGLEIRPAEGLAVAEGRPLGLSPREAALLTTLAQARGRVVAREELYRRAWGHELRPGDRSIDVYVHKLRHKLEAALPGRSFIHTHVGFGYRFEPLRSHDVHTNVTG